MPHFIDRNYDSPARPRPAPRPRAAAAAARRRSAGSAPAVAAFFDDERLHRLFSFQALYAGLAPARGPRPLRRHHLHGHRRRRVVPEGGMHAVPPALAAAAAKAGRRRSATATRVERIVLRRRHDGAGARRRGSPTASCVAADAVVCNADLPVAYRTLLPGLRRPACALRAGDYSPSARRVARRRRAARPPPAPRHHNIHFGGDWAARSTRSLDDGVRMPDPSILVTVPTARRPDARARRPPRLYALEPVPNLDGARRLGTSRAPRRASGSRARVGRPRLPATTS